MKCQIAQEQIVAAAYGELAEEQARELERHVAVCPECTEEHEQLLSLKALADASPVLEPDANLVLELRDAESAAVISTEDGYAYVIMPLARDQRG